MQEACCLKAVKTIVVVCCSARDQGGGSRLFPLFLSQFIIFLLSVYIYRRSFYGAAHIPMVNLALSHARYEGPPPPPQRTPHEEYMCTVHHGQHINGLLTGVRLLLLCTVCSL
jgi:hypothetical protein